jgi:hypothetical protein
MPSGTPISTAIVVDTATRKTCWANSVASS